MVAFPELALAHLRLFRLPVVVVELLQDGLDKRDQTSVSGPLSCGNEAAVVILLDALVLEDPL